MGLYLHFGAGNIGRALAGPVFHGAGYEVVFVDAVPEIVSALHRRRGYRVLVKDTVREGTPRQFDIYPVDGLAVHDTEAVKAALARADLIGTAVGAAHLPSVLEVIASGLPLRNGRPVSILFLENLHGLASMAEKILAAHLPPGFPLKQQIGLVETSIGKMVPIMPQDVRRRDPLEVWGEAYNKIIADRCGFVGPPPEGIEGLELKSCFRAHVERKLYIHNLGHATCAYYGFLKGFRLICDAIEHKEIHLQTQTVMMSTARALVRRYPSEFDEAGQAAHVDDLLRRFGNRALGDTVYRVGRDLPRKLAPDDRFIGGMRLVQSEGGDPTPICRALGAALCFAATDENGLSFAPDEAFRRRLELEGVEAVLCARHGFDPVSDKNLLSIILDAYKHATSTVAKISQP